VTKGVPHADRDVLAGLAALADAAEVECRELHATFMQDRAALAAIAEHLAGLVSNAFARRRAAG